MTSEYKERNQMPSPCPLCKTGRRRRDELNAQEFQSVLDNVIGCSGDEIKRMASKIQSLISISAVEKSPTRYAPQPDNSLAIHPGATAPVARTGVISSSDSNSQGASGVSISRYRAIQPRFSETSNRLASYPTRCNNPHPAVGNKGPHAFSDGGGERNRVSAQNTDNEPRRDYQLATASADAVVQGLGSPNTLVELQRAILQQRNHLFCDFKEPLTPFPNKKEANEQEIANQLSGIQTHFGKFQPNEHIKLIAERYQGALIVRLYDHYKKCNKRGKGKSSLGVVFTEILLKPWVRKNLTQSMTKRVRRTKMRTKWKTELQKTRFWYDLNKRFGCGILSLLPQQFRNNHAHRLNRPDEKELLRRIEEKYPNLEADLEHLTFLMRYLFTNGELPQKQLLLETLSEPEIKECCQSDFRVLLQFSGPISPIQSEAAMQHFDTQQAPEFLHQGGEILSRTRRVPLQTIAQKDTLSSSAVSGPQPTARLNEFTANKSALTDPSSLTESQVPMSPHDMVFYFEM